MKTNRIKCSKLYDNSMEIQENQPKSLKKHSYKTTSEEICSDEQLDKISDTENYDDRDLSYPIKYQPSLNRILNPKVRTNHIKCTDINKYFRKVARNNQIDKKTEQPVEENLTVDNSMMIKDNLGGFLEEEVRTNHVKCSTINESEYEPCLQTKVEECVEEVNGTQEEFLDDTIEHNGEYTYDTAEQSKDNEEPNIDKDTENIIESDNLKEDMQTCNISIKASPLILNLLENIKVTNPNKDDNTSKSFNIADFITIENLDNTEEDSSL